MTLRYLEENREWNKQDEDERNTRCLHEASQYAREMSKEAAARWGWGSLPARYLRAEEMFYRHPFRDVNGNAVFVLDEKVLSTLERLALAEEIGERFPMKP